MTSPLTAADGLADGDVIVPAGVTDGLAALGLALGLPPVLGTPLVPVPVPPAPPPVLPLAPVPPPVPAPAAPVPPEPLAPAPDPPALPAPCAKAATAGPSARAPIIMIVRTYVFIVFLPSGYSPHDCHASSTPSIGLPVREKRFDALSRRLLHLLSLHRCHLLTDLGKLRVVPHLLDARPNVSFFLFDVVLERLPQLLYLLEPRRVRWL